MKALVKPCSSSKQQLYQYFIKVGEHTSDTRSQERWLSQHRSAGKQIHKSQGIIFHHIIEMGSLLLTLKFSHQWVITITIHNHACAFLFYSLSLNLYINWYLWAHLELLSGHGPAPRVPAVRGVTSGRSRAKMWDLRPVYSTVQYSTGGGVTSGRAEMWDLRPLHYYFCGTPHIRSRGQHSTHTSREYGETVLRYASNPNWQEISSVEWSKDHKF